MLTADAAGGGDPTPPVRIGCRIPFSLFEQDARALRACVARVEAVGLDHVCIGDHVSFHGGQGFDGLLQAAALASLTSSLVVETAVYLLVLRHPVPVARQIATLAQLAPGRFVFGVGLGGEDRHELEVCGVDPATRGRRLDESLRIVSALLAGETVDFTGRCFQVEGATIRPSPPEPVPIVIGGRSDAALRRTARHGDGWLGLFVSADRYADAVATVAELAVAEGRTGVVWQHGMHVWCGVGSHDRLAETMESLYQLPFERFARYAPWGTADDIAASVRPYLDAGARHVNLATVAATPEAAIDAAAEVAELLRRS
jgi:alkanesulfonate monooxygenase SsuD/methylene tetrahydromethanopterin reductase-like flavin-dependent oxidoreductase (luciferase family)